MAFFKKKESKHTPVSAMHESERDLEIARLESERIRINTEIEQVLKNYAKESGNKRLRFRRFRMGKSPNDYGFGRKK